MSDKEQLRELQQAVREAVADLYREPGPRVKEIRDDLLGALTMSRKDKLNCAGCGRRLPAEALVAAPSGKSYALLCPTCAALRSTQPDSEARG